MSNLSTDVLILGSGLAGLRAAWAAKEAHPKLEVTVVSRKTGPSGSSFANRNNALGMQVPTSDEERETMRKEIVKLAVPGYVDESLVRIMADEAEARYAEMLELGLKFRRDDAGQVIRYPGCGSTRARAAIFDNLSHAFNQFFAKTYAYQCEFLTRTEVLGLHVRDDKALGAWCADRSGTPFSIGAKAVIVALGGAATLYDLKVCGPGTGYGLALLDESGAALENTGYLQFMWHDRKGNFRNPADLLQHGNAVITPDFRELEPRSITDEILHLRSTHCPAFHGQPDTILDTLLVEQRHGDGYSCVRTPEGVVEIAPMAHASNGGAVTDANGQTSIEGLYAVGECATGMHGANRLGGAMVMATQVFGRRAGLAAAHMASGSLAPAVVPQPPTMPPLLPDHPKLLEEIRRGMTRNAAFAPTKELPALLQRLWDICSLTNDRRLCLASLSAAIIAQGLDNARKDGVVKGA